MPSRRARLAALVLAPLLTTGLIVASGQDAPPPAKDGADAGATGASDERAPDLVAPPPALAPHLARFDGEAEPGRELKRAFVSVVAYLLAADVERALPYFHPDLRFHVGAGDLEAVPPERLREQLKEQRADGPRPELTEVLDLASVRAYSRARAREVDAAAEGWQEIEPGQVARLMRDDDWLVMARLVGDGFGRETFYVFRKDGPRYKVVLAE